MGVRSLCPRLLMPFLNQPLNMQLVGFIDECRNICTGLWIEYRPCLWTWFFEVFGC